MGINDVIHKTLSKYSIALSSEDCVTATGNVQKILWSLDMLF